MGLGAGTGSLLTIGSALLGATQALGITTNYSQQQTALRENLAQTRKATQEAISDRMRKARSELGTLQALELSSEGMRDRFITELAYVEGIDLQRINSTLKRQEDNLKYNKRTLNKNLSMSLINTALQTGLSFYSNVATTSLENQARTIKLQQLQNIYPQFL